MHLVRRRKREQKLMNSKITKQVTACEYWKKKIQMSYDVIPQDPKGIKD